MEDTNRIQSATIRLWPDAGKRIGLGKTATYQAAKNKEIPVLRIGRRYLVPTAALERLLGAHPESEHGASR